MLELIQSARTREQALSFARHILVEFKSNESIAAAVLRMLWEAASGVEELYKVVDSFTDEKD